MDDKTARKYRALGKLPSEVVKPHDWTTRPNPYAAVWDEIRELLQSLREGDFVDRKENRLVARTLEARWEEALGATARLAAGPLATAAERRQHVTPP